MKIKEKKKKQQRCAHSGDTNNESENNERIWKNPNEDKQQQAAHSQGIQQPRK